jgi:hypothetical protein
MMSSPSSRRPSEIDRDSQSLRICETVAQRSCHTDTASDERQSALAAR